MDKLVRISLVNWYLFSAEDIPINGDVILFRGANGAGKSSLLDALQALFAGGDENELLMNAASSDGRRSGRSIRSYVLGTLADKSSDQMSHTRKEASSYIMASFQRMPNSGDESRTLKKSASYAIGLALHAKQSDQKVTKNRFIIEGRQFSTEDAITADGYVRPWKIFERHLVEVPGQVYLPTTASEFRYYCAELMSAPGIDQKISPNAMLRALKKGIGFKEQKCISQFTREHVLPENTIDVLRVQNDYEEYRRIYELMEEAKHRLFLLNQIMTAYGEGIHHLQQATAYDWCFHQVRVEALQYQYAGQQASLIEKQKAVNSLHLELDNLHQKTTQVQNNRDEALSHFRQTDHFSAIKRLDDKIVHLQKEHFAVVSTMKSTQVKLQVFAALPIARLMSDTLKTRLQQQQLALVRSIAVEDDLLSQWPINQSHIETMNLTIGRFEPLEHFIASERDRNKTKLDQMQERVVELESALSSAQSGHAKLHASTVQVIQLLADAGIEAKPVCELARITDESWQIGIERFLGSNREALVVESLYYEEALRVYRKAKDIDERLRAVKLVNPDKGFGFSGKPSKTTAAALIESENAVALRFLRGLVHNVELVGSELELRKAKRAITRDGMVAGNGAISGGNRFRWVLIGQDARRGHAEGLATALVQLQKEFHQLQHDFGPLESLNREFSTQFHALDGLSLQLLDQLAIATEMSVTLDALLLEREALQKSPNAKLEAGFEEANEALLAHQKHMRDLEIRVSSESRDFERLNHSIPETEKALSEARGAALHVQNEDNWCEGIANLVLQDLNETDFETTENVQRQALEGKKSCSSVSQKALLSGTNTLTEYLSRYEPEDRSAFSEMSIAETLKRCESHRDQIQETQMLMYLEDAKQARETMLDNFRFEVVAKLKDAFETIKSTFRLLNKQLETLTFNNTQYQFIFPLVETPILKSVYEYVNEATAYDGQEVGTLFDELKDHPGVQIIEEVLVEGRLSEISDYRNFFTYDILATDRISGVRRYFSELLLNGSGGEKQTPFYVALGASFMTAFKIQKNGDQLIGGVGLALFDEAFSKMDGNNAQTALSFFKDIGLQVILAAPPESEVKVGPFVDATFTILRSGTQVYLDHKRFTEEGKTLLRSDEPANIVETI